MSKIFKIWSVLFFIIAISGIAYLSITLDTNKGYTISIIEIEGNNLLDKSEYYKFARLNNKNGNEELSLSTIKNRLKKHPYIESLEVEYSGNNKVLVSINEKQMEAILFNNQKQYLLTANFQVLPVLPFTKLLDYPVLSNPNLNKKLNMNSILKSNKDILIGYKIIETFKLANLELYSMLSEIDLRLGKDIVLTFSNLNFPIVLGRNNEIKKAFYFSTLWGYLKDKQINNMMDYVDIRFSKHMYLGINEAVAMGEG